MAQKHTKEMHVCPRHGLKIHRVYSSSSERHGGKQCIECYAERKRLKRLIDPTYGRSAAEKARRGLSSTSAPQPAPAPSSKPSREQPFVLAWLRRTRRDDSSDLGPRSGTRRATTYEGKQRAAAERIGEFKGELKGEHVHPSELAAALGKEILAQCAGEPPENIIIERRDDWFIKTCAELGVTVLVA